MPHAGSRPPPKAASAPLTTGRSPTPPTSDPTSSAPGQAGPASSHRRTYQPITQGEPNQAPASDAAVIPTRATTTPTSRTAPANSSSRKRATSPHRQQADGEERPRSTGIGNEDAGAHAGDGRCRHDGEHGPEDRPEQQTHGQERERAITVVADRDQDEHDEEPHHGPAADAHHGHPPQHLPEHGAPTHGRGGSDRITRGPRRRRPGGRRAGHGPRRHRPRGRCRHPSGRWGRRRWRSGGGCRRTVDPLGAVPCPGGAGDDPGRAVPHRGARSSLRSIAPWRVAGLAVRHGRQSATSVRCGQGV